MKHRRIMESLDGYNNRYGWCPYVTLMRGSVHDHRCRADPLWQCTCHRCRYSCVPPSHGTCELVWESACATPSQGTVNDHRWRAPFLCITVHDYVLSMFTSWSCLDRYFLCMMMPYDYDYWHYVHRGRHLLMLFMTCNLLCSHLLMCMMYLFFLTAYSYTHYPIIMFLQVMQQGPYMSQKLHSD